ncbi:MAG: hypothetical protein E6J18_00140 [Chloroflexi bacterium]|nr:MAG: hypothetical protein E6J18_00140 [Chloroflexota bacterium]
MKERGDRRRHARCSFCGKGEQQVRKLVAGPGVFICDGCIELCSEVLREDEHPTAPGSFHQHPSSLRARISCWFRNLLQVRGYST